tara:strand:- start:2235 stop:2456 length:222 start_codon:yes stop_codon:yes gene_type:complete
MKSSRDVFEGLKKNLEYLEWHSDDDNAVVVQGCIRHVGWLEEIIKELIGETVALNKALKHTCEVLENNTKEVE